MDEIIGILIAAIIAAIVMNQLKGLQRVIAYVLIGLAAVALISITTASGPSLPQWLANVIPFRNNATDTPNGTSDTDTTVDSLDPNNQNNQTNQNNQNNGNDPTSPTTPPNTTTDRPTDPTPTNPSSPNDPTVPSADGSSNRRPVSGMW